MKKAAVFLAALICVCAMAQEPLQHEKRVYISPEGHMYIQKELPVYLWLSTSPKESSEKYLLKSEATKKYSNPMYFDTEGYNTVRSPSQVDTITKKPVYPLHDIIFEVYTDSRAPVSKISYGDASTYSKDGKIFVSADVELSVTARDQMSGVDEIYFSMDSVAYKPYEGPIKLTVEKEHLLQFYAVDNVGNMEEVHRLTIVYDKTAPKTMFKIEGDRHEDVLSGKTKIILESDDKGIGVSRILYSIDQGEIKKYIKPIHTAYFSQGEHTLVFYGLDHVENEENKTTFSFYVDNTPPTIIEEIMGKTFFANGKEFSSGKSRLKLTAFDNKAGVKEIKYSVNGGDFLKYDKPVFLSQVSGNLVVDAYAVDNVNNNSSSQSSSQKSSVPYIDLTGPTLKHSFSGPRFETRDTVFINGSTKIALNGIDSESGMKRIEYKIDRDELKEYTNPFSVVNEGYHTISLTGFDNVDNTSTTDFGFMVDNSGPSISSQFSTTSTGTMTVDDTTLSKYPSYVVLFLSSTDRVVGFDEMTYRVNSGSAKGYNSMIGKFQQRGETVVDVNATDKLGNETTATFRFFVE
jgi:hypothetical protein